MTHRSPLDAMASLSVRPDGVPAVLDFLRASQFVPSEELLRRQLRRAERVVAHARATTSFYAELPEVPAGGFDLARFGALPTLHRLDVLRNADALTSDSPPPGHHVVREANSSGSTGRHVTVKVDATSASLSDAFALRGHAWHRRDVRAKAAAIRAVPKGADAPQGRTEAAWSRHPESGPLALLNVHTTVREQLEWLSREAPAYVVTYASNAAALVAHAERAGISLPGLREMGTFGEVVPDGLRDACLRVFGVPIVDTYSTAELGHLALQCPEHEHYHVQSESVLLEVLREDGEPCVPGEVGRVVVTALHAFAMPLLRYETGDYALLGEPCRCGRQLPVLERIFGRARNMLRLPNGDTLWPRYGSTLLGKRFPLEQFRLVQRSLDALVLEIVPARPLRATEEQAIRRLVLEVVRHPFDLELRVVPHIARAVGGKFEDFVCEIPEG